MITFDVAGRPAPQGSKTYMGRGRMVEASKYVKPWRADVYAAAMSAKARGYSTITGPVHLTVVFALDRPKSHYRTGRNAHLLRDSAPEYPTGVPDLSKLIRSTEDALTDAKIWRDDALVAQLTAVKVYVGHPAAPSLAGARITVREVRP